MSAGNEAKRRTCQDCGMVCHREGEFHPWLFCLLVKAGVTDPWGAFRLANGMLGVDLDPTPPLVRDLQADDDSEAGR